VSFQFSEFRGVVWGRLFFYFEVAKKEKKFFFRLYLKKVFVPLYFEILGFIHLKKKIVIWQT